MRCGRRRSRRSLHGGRRSGVRAWGGELERECECETRMRFLPLQDSCRGSHVVVVVVVVESAVRCLRAYVCRCSAAVGPTSRVRRTDICTGVVVGTRGDATAAMSSSCDRKGLAEEEAARESSPPGGAEALQTEQT
eukprot:GHVU01121911.1.p1 GENE.GHVU01121911.1~~GHVU01121911.1.p1  ORF type:complete len:136 (-),score=17.35 GHVU01121911.1:113-520(-)